MRIIARLFAWLLTAVVTFVTLGPPRYRPETDFGHDTEHAFAFILVGLLFGLGYPARKVWLAGIATVLIGVLEILQIWMPGRHARVEDFVVDALAACAGVAVAALLDWIVVKSGRRSTVE